MSGMHQHALAYIEGRVFDWPVAIFPLVARGKKPLTSRGFQDATTDPNQIRRWWLTDPDANVGLPLQGNGLCAVDLDGPDGLRTWSELGVEYPGPVTCCTETGSGGGHLIYGVPDAREPRGTVGVFPNVDLRGPGYVVAPPSVHPNGSVYRWVMPPARLAPQTAPEWILETLGSIGPSVPPYDPRIDSHTPYGRTALLATIDEVAGAPEGARNQTLYARTRRVLDLIASGDLEEHNALEVLRMAADLTGLPEREIERTVASAIGGRHVD